MVEELKTKIRALYMSLQGMLEQAPQESSTYTIYDPNYWEDVNRIIDEIATLTELNYDSWKITTQPSHNLGKPTVTTNAYKTKLAGLINYLKGQFFNDESLTALNNGVTVNNTQTQSIQLSIVLEIQGAIDKKLYSEKLENDEKSFLEKLRSSLSNVKSSMELINLVLTTALDMGFDVSKIIKLFS